jgi:GntR family transcriptional regulator
LPSRVTGIAGVVSDGVCENPMPGVPARTFHQRQRQRDKRAPGNNSARRTYDLLRFSLHHLEPDSRLVEEKLVDSLSASRNTVRATLRLLAEQGLVTRRPKTGTTVATSLVLPVNEVMTVAEFDNRGRVPPATRLLEALVIPAPEIIRERLALAADASVLILEGVLLDDGEPFAVSVSYVGLDDPAQGVAEGAGPDAIAFLEDLGVALGASHTTVGAVTTDAQTATLLGVAEGSPALWLEDLLRDVHGRPRALCQFRFRSDRVAFTSETHRRPVAVADDRAVPTDSA